MTTPHYSVIIPLKDEADNIQPLIEELMPVMEGLGKPWEVLCIDDGSTDGTTEIIRRLAAEHSCLRPLFFTRNYGQSSAFDAGFRHAKGDYIISLDGDRQNDPADIPKLIHAMEEADLVCGTRIKRRDNWWRRIVSRSGNAVRRKVCQDGMRDNNCSLKAYRRSCLQKIKMYEGMHRFLPALFKIEGFRVCEVPVNHRERTKGKSKYNMLNRGVNTVFDLFAVLWMRKRHLSYQTVDEQ